LKGKKGLLQFPRRREMNSPRVAAADRLEHMRRRLPEASWGTRTEPVGLDQSEMFTKGTEIAFGNRSSTTVQTRPKTYAISSRSIAIFSPGVDQITIAAGFMAKSGSPKDEPALRGGKQTTPSPAVALAEPPAADPARPRSRPSAQFLSNATCKENPESTIIIRGERVA